MGELFPISTEEVLSNFLDSVDADIMFSYPFITENKELYHTWSDTLVFIMENYPSLAERAQYLAQYLDTLFNDIPF